MSISESLKDVDKEIYDICYDEIAHQNKTLSLNANDNIISKACLESAANVFVNCYPENYVPFKSMNRISLYDKVEKIANKRALDLFKLNPNEWGVNLRPVSGTAANLITFFAIAGVQGKILALREEYGGHHSMNFLGNFIQSAFTEKIFHPETFVSNEDGTVNYDEIRKRALEVRPKIIIAGSYALSIDFNYKKMKKIAQESGAVFLGDISHPAGLIAHNFMKNPFLYCDIVTGVFQKTLSGPRAGFIYFKKEYSKRILDTSTIICGNSHTHMIIQQAVALKEAASAEHYILSKKTIRNAQKLRQYLKAKGFVVLKTNSHMILFDLECSVLSYVFEIIADDLYISLNRLTISRNPERQHPTGMRLGTTGYTRRGIPSKHLKKIATVFYKIRKMSQNIIKEQNLTEKTMYTLKRDYKQSKLFSKLSKTVQKIIKKSPIFSVAL